MGEVLPLLLLTPVDLGVPVVVPLPDLVKDRDTVKEEEVLGLRERELGGEGVTDALDDFPTDTLLAEERDPEGHLEDVLDTLGVREEVRVAEEQAVRVGVRLPLGELVTLLGLELPP